MDKVIKDRIDTVNNHRTPLGYYRTKDIGLAPTDWVLGIMSDVVTPIKRAVPKPDKPYWRLGIKSWAKGTFRTYVDQPEAVDMDELYEVHENDLVVNITFAWEHAIAVAAKDDQGLLVSHRFPTYEFKDNQVPNFYRSVISQKFFKDMLEHISPGGAGRNRVLNQKDFLNLPCYIPSLSEQEKISEILDHYDKLIKLCEAKLYEYKSLKKTCLSKMFPRNGSTVPELRFPEFTGVWEQRKLEGLAEFNPKSDLPEQFEYVDLESVVGTEMIAHRTEQRASAPSRAQRLAQPGDLFYQTVRPYQKNNHLFEKPDNDYVFSTGYAQMRPYCDGHFLLCLVQTDIFLKYVLDRCTGTSYPAINANDLAEMSVHVPISQAEQEAIGKFFAKLDHLITLHQREVEEYTRLKKAMTQLLLTGIVRVKG